MADSAQKQTDRRAMSSTTHSNQIARPDVGYLQDGLRRRPFQHFDDDVEVSLLETLGRVIRHFLPYRNVTRCDPIPPRISQIAGHWIKGMDDDHLGAITQGKIARIDQGLPGIGRTIRGQ
jgi:hypothetical protein